MPEEVKVLIGKDTDGDWQADIADDDWDGGHDIDWVVNPRRFIFKIEDPEPPVTIIEVKPLTPPQTEVKETQ